MRNFRKAGAGIAVLALASLSLAACSSDADKTKKDTETSSSSDTQIQFIHRLPDGEGMTKVDEIVKKWNKENPDKQVKATKFDGKAQELTKKLETDIKADNGPCLAQLGYSEVPEMYTKGLVEDVTKQAEAYKDKFAAGPFSLMSVDGKTVGLPQDTGPLVYYYNKAEFEKLGIEAPKNLDDFKAAAKKAAAAAGKYIADFQPDESAFWLSAQAAAAGDSWYKVENNKWAVKTDGEGSQKVAAFWQDLLDSKAVLTENRWDDSFKKALGDKKLIGTIGAAWEAPLLVDDMAGTDNEGEWAVTQLPDYGQGVKSGPDGGSGVAVMKGCKAPEAAVDFAGWFNTQIEPLVSQGLVVAAKGDAKTPEKISKFYGGQDVFAELSKANEVMAQDFGYMPGFSGVMEEMNKTAANTATGEKKVADVFKTAQDASVKSLQDQKLPVAN